MKDEQAAVELGRRSKKELRPIRRPSDGVVGGRCASTRVSFGFSGSTATISLPSWNAIQPPALAKTSWGGSSESFLAASPPPLQPATMPSSPATARTNRVFRRLGDARAASAAIAASRIHVDLMTLIARRSVCWRAHVGEAAPHLHLDSFVPRLRPAAVLEADDPPRRSRFAHSAVTGRSRGEQAPVTHAGSTVLARRRRGLPHSRAARGSRGRTGGPAGARQAARPARPSPPPSRRGDLDRPDRRRAVGRAAAADGREDRPKPRLAAAPSARGRRLGGRRSGHARTRLHAPRRAGEARPGHVRAARRGGRARARLRAGGRGGRDAS